MHLRAGKKKKIVTGPSLNILLLHYIFFFLLYFLFFFLLIFPRKSIFYSFILLAATTTSYPLFLGPIVYFFELSLHCVFSWMNLVSFFEIQVPLLHFQIWFLVLCDSTFWFLENFPQSANPSRAHLLICHHHRRAPPWKAISGHHRARLGDLLPKNLARSQSEWEEQSGPLFLDPVHQSVHAVVVGVKVVGRRHPLRRRYPLSVPLPFATYSSQLQKLINMDPTKIVGNLNLPC